MENKENIFIKFINFIKKLFKNETPKQISSKIESTSKSDFVKLEQKSSFMDELKLYKEEDPTLLKLQNQFEKNEIDLSMMSNEEINALNALYKRQVSELKKKLTDKKTELNIIQYKIKNHSVNM